MKVLKPLEVDAANNRDNLKIFLAGSIEQGAASNWQDYVIHSFKDCDIEFYNPRRDGWDNSWGENSPELLNQINWELTNLEVADLIVLYLDPNTKSPISLLELGLYAKSNKLIVCCPDEFYRKTNILVTCEKYNIPLFSNLEGFIAAIFTEYDKFSIEKQMMPSIDYTAEIDNELFKRMLNLPA